MGCTALHSIRSAMQRRPGHHHHPAPPRPLVQASTAGNVQLVESLLQQQQPQPQPEEAPLTEEVDEHGWTALMRAASRGHVRVVESLLRARADVHRTNPTGATALHCAVWSGNVAVARALIRAGADMYVPNISGATPLHVACFRNKPKIVQLLLLESGADGPHSLWDERRDAFGAHALHVCALNGRLRCAQLLLTMQPRSSAKCTDVDLWTPLHCAAHVHDTSMCALLLQHDESASFARNVRGETPLDVALRENKDKEVIHFLSAKKTAQLIFTLALATTLGRRSATFMNKCWLWSVPTPLLVSLREFLLIPRDNPVEHQNAAEIELTYVPLQDPANDLSDDGGEDSLEDEGGGGLGEDEEDVDMQT